MRINVFFDRENKKEGIELEEKSSVGELLSLLKINPVTVLVVKNKEIVLQDELLSNNDEIKILSVVSGG